MNNLDEMKKRRNQVSALIVILIVLNLLLLLVFATTLNEDGNNVGKEDAISVVSDEPSTDTNTIEGNPNIADVVTGANFTIALDSNGRVWAWGQNNRGQLGDGTLIDSIDKQPVSSDKIDSKTGEHIQLSNVKQIAAGEYHAAALTNDGEVYIWGYNYFGQIGRDDIKKGKYPEKLVIPNGSKIKQIACGANYTILLTTDGKVLGVGDSSDGQLGYYNDLSFTSIREIEELKDSADKVLPSIKYVSGGYNHILALDNNNKIWSWGDNVGSGFEFTQIKEISITGTPIQIKAGNNVSMALTDSGKIYTWDLSGTPIEVTLPTKDDGTNIQIRTDNTKDNIAIVNKTYFIIDENNNVYSWGQNSAGQAGVGNYTATISTPTKLVTNPNVTINNEIDKVTSSSVPGVSVNGATASNGQYDTAYAINADGYVLGWGYAGIDIVDPSYTEGSNTGKLLGDASRNVADYIGSVSVKSITGNDIKLHVSESKDLMQMLTEKGYATGGRVNLYRKEKATIKDSLTVKSVNENIASYDEATGMVTGIAMGQTSAEIKSSKNTIYINIEVIDDNLTFPKIETRNNYTVALKADGTVWGWGYNSDLGIQDLTHSHNGIIVPTQVKGINEKIKDISAGENFVLLLTENGEVLSWGANNAGQLGNGETSSSKVNSIITDEVKLSKVGTFNTKEETKQVKVLAEVPVKTADTDGNVIYTDTNGNKYNPNGDDFEDLQGNIVIKKDTDGNLYKWNYQNNDFVKNTVTETVLNPGVLSNIESISAGYNHALAVDEAGKVWSWGNNDYAKLGLHKDKTTSYEVLAKEVDLSNIPAEETIKQIEAGRMSSYILTEEGNVYAWGYSGNYLCGNINTAYVYIPTKINALSKITKISAGMDGNGYVVGLTVNGNVWKWGYRTNSGYPSIVSGLNNVIDIEVADNTSGVIAKFADGTVGYCTNMYNANVVKFTTPNGTDNFTNVSLINGGNGAYVVSKPDGTVWTVGANGAGQLGNRTTVSTSATTLGDISKAYITLDKHEVTLKENETVNVNATYKYGFNLLHDEEDKTMTYTSLDDNIATVSGNTITAVKSGKTYVIAEDSATGVKLRVTVNVLSAQETAVPDISAGYNHTISLKADGTVWGFGYNGYGELGAQIGLIGEPEKLGIDGTYKDVAAGNYYSLMLTTEGIVKAMGYNGYGQLGNNTTTNATTPVIVQKQTTDAEGNIIYVDLNNIEKIESIGNISLALDKDGNLYAWGYGANAYATPVNTYGFKVTEITGNLILTEDGRVWEYINWNTLRFIDGLDNIVEISSSQYSNGTSYGYFMALDAEGKVYTWVKSVNNYNCVTGLETTKPTLQTIADGIKVVDIQAGVGSAYVRDIDGNLYAWGNYAGAGTLGLGTSVGSSSTPVKIATLENIEKVEASRYSNGNKRAYAVNTKGAVYGFGYNGGSSLLGNGETDTYYYEPKLVGESYAGFLIDGEPQARLYINKGESVDIQAALLDAFSLRLTTASTSSSTDFEWEVVNADLVSLQSTTGNTNTITANNIIGEATLLATDKITGKTAKLYIDVKVANTEVAPKIESTGDHTVSLKADGTVWVWGNNNFGELGILETGVIREPKQARIAEKVTVKEPVEKLDENGIAVVDEDGKAIYVDEAGNEYYKAGNNYTNLQGATEIVYNNSESIFYKWDNEEANYALEDLKDEEGNNIIVTDIATSNYHTLMLTKDGDVYSCGYYGYSQLGYYTNGNQYLPKKIDGLKDIVKIATGDRYSLALDKYGRLWAFGYTHFHVSSDRLCHEPINSVLPTRVKVCDGVNIEETLRNAIDITNQYVLTKDGEVIALRVSNTDVPTGTKVAGIDEKVIKITKTTGHTAFLTENGKLYTIGSGAYGQLGNEEWSNSNVTTGNNYTAVSVRNTENEQLDNIRDVYTGETHTIAIDKNNQVYTWGSNANGELRSSQVQAGVRLARAYKVAEDSKIKDAILVSAGNGYSIVVDETGFAYAWGAGTSGQLGDGLTVNSIEARRVGIEGLKLDKNHVTLVEKGKSIEVNAYNKQLNLIYNPTIQIKNASMSTDATVALANKVSNATNQLEIRPVKAGTTSAVVTSIGDNGEEFNSIIQITVLPEIAEISDDVILPINKIVKPMTASGKNHTLILKADGTVWAYGDNTFGQTGAKNTKYSDKETQVQFPDGTPSIISIATGDNFSLALDVNGVVYAWGNNRNGQLGLGTTSTGVNDTPVAVMSGIVKISANGSQAMALNKNGYAYAWGMNTSGSLGIGSTSDASYPQQIRNVANIIDIAVGNDHAMLLTANGAVYTTGKNASGQLGAQYILNRLSFEKVEISNPIEYISAGNRTSAAIDTNGNLWVWGNNEDGQLGLGIDDKFINTPTIATVGAGLKAESASVGNNHVQVVTSNGELYIAGSNNYGQLGVGTGIERTNTFVKVSKLGNNVMASNAGTTYSTAITDDGTVYGFGDYNQGNLNRVSRTNSFEPVMISNNTSSLDEQEIVVKLNETYTINPNGRYKLNVLHKDESTFTYKSVNEEIASVDDKGVVTANAIGTTMISVEDEIGKVNAVIVKVVPEDALQSPTIESGDKFAVVTDKNGTAYLFGNKENIISNSVPKTTNDSVSFKTIKAGDGFIVGINNDGSVWAWGDNSQGQLGIENTDKTEQIVRLNTNYIKGATQIDAGSNHVIALDELGIAYVWGSNSNGQLGINMSTTNVEIPTVIRPTTNRIISVSAGGDYSSIVDTTGSAYIIKNGAAQKVSGINGAIKVATGLDKTMVLTSDGKVYIVDNATNSVIPKVLDKVIVDIATNKDTFMCLSQNKELYTFGNNQYGQLGANITANSSSTLRKVAEDVFTIGGGYDNTYYIGTNGEVLAAGLNTNGQLGNGTENNADSQTKVSSAIYTKVGDRGFRLDEIKENKIIKDVNSTRVSIDWSVLVGGADLEELLGAQKIKLILINEKDEFNVFKENGEGTLKLEDYNFSLTDTNKADLQQSDIVEITTKELGKTTLEVTNKVTGEVKELEIIIVDEKLLRIEDIYVVDSDNKQYNSEPEGDSNFVINVEGASATGTLNIALEYDDTLKVFDSEGNELTVTKNAETENWEVAGLDLTKSIQELTLKLTTEDGTELEYKVIIRKNAVVKVDEETLAPVNDEYTKFINPANTEATVEITILDETQHIQLEDTNGNIIATTTAGETTLKTVVQVPQHKNEFIIKIINSANKVEREAKLTILKSSVESLYITDIKNTPNEVLANRKEGSGEYVDEFSVRIDEANAPAVVKMNIINNNVQSIKVDGVEVANASAVTFTTQNEVAEIELTVLDAGTGATYIEKYKLTIDKITSENGIEQIELTRVNGNTVIMKDPMFKEAPDEDYAYQIVLHDEQIELNNTNFKVTLKDIKSKVSANNRIYHESGYEFTGVPTKLSENKYQYDLYVKADNGDVQKYTLYIYKESEDAKIKDITVISPLDDGTTKEIEATKKDGTDDYTGKVIKGQDKYEVKITLRDEYSSIESIAIEGIDASDIGNYITLKSSEDGVYTYEVTKDVIGKVIKIVSKPEYDKAPTVVSTLTLEELSDNSEIESIKLGNLPPLNLDEDTIEAAIASNDSSILAVKAKNDNATVEIYLSDPSTGDAEAFAKGIGSVSKEIPLNEGETQTVFVKVTAEDGIHATIKRIEIRRKSANVNITNVHFTINGETQTKEYVEGKEIELSESFVKGGIATIKVTTEDSNATATVEGIENEIGAQVDLTQQNTINVVVTAEDGTTKSYTIKVKILSADTGITKEIQSTNGAVLKADSDFVQDGDNRYVVTVKGTGDVNLVVKSIANAKVELRIKDTETKAENKLTVNALAQTEVIVTVTAEDGTTKEYTIIVKPEDPILQSASVVGVNASNTALSTVRALTNEELIAGYAKVRVHPDATKAQIALVANSNYLPVTVNAIANQGMVDDQGNSLEKTYTTTISSTSGTSIYVDLLDDDVTNVVINMVSKDGVPETLVVDVERGSIEAKLESATVIGKTTQTEETKSYINPIVWKQNIEMDSTDDLYNITAKCAENGTYKLYKISDADKDTQINNINLTTQTEITKDTDITLTHTYQRFVIEVLAEFGTATERYDLYVRKISNNADLEDLTITVDNDVTLHLADFGEFDSNDNIDIIVPMEVKDINMSNLVLSDEYATARWTAVTSLTKDTATDSDYSDYVDGSEINYSVVLPTDLQENSVKHVYIKVTAENGDEKVYCLNIKKATNDVRLLSTELFDITNNKNDEIQVKDNLAKVTEAVEDAKVVSKANNAISIKVTKVNGHIVKEAIATEKSKVGENSLSIAFTQDYTYEDETGAIKTITAQEVKEVVVETTVVSRGYELYPTYYAGKNESEYKATYEIRIARLLANTDLAIEMLNLDGTTTNIDTKVFVADKPENNIPVYTYECKVPSTQTSVTLNNVKANNPYAKVEHRLVEGNDLYTAANPYVYSESSFAEDKASVTEIFKVTTELGNSAIYKLKITKKSANNEIDKVIVNANEAIRTAGTDNFDAVELKPINKLKVILSAIEKDATVNMNITKVNNTNVSVATGEVLEKVSTDNKTKQTQKDLTDQLLSAIGQLGITKADVNTITVAITVQAEDTDIALRTYTLNINVIESNLISIDGLDEEGVVDSSVKLTAEDFNAIGGGQFKTDEITVPSDTNIVELSNILCENDDLAEVTDASGKVLTDRKLTVKVAETGVTNVSINVKIGQISQTFIISIRRKSTDTTIKQVVSGGVSTDKIDDVAKAYVVSVKDTVDPEVTVVLNDANAKVIDIKPVLSTTTITGPEDNKFTVIGVAQDQHNVAEDTSSDGKTIDVVVTVEAEDGNTQDYTIRLERKHTETGLGEVKFLADTEKTVSFENTDKITREISSTTEGIKILSADTVCENAKVYVEYVDDATGAVIREAIDASKLYTINEATEKTFNIIVVAEFGNEKSYSLTIRREGADTGITNIDVVANGRTEQAKLDVTPYTAFINVDENPTISITTSDTTYGEVTNVRVYKQIAGDLSGVTVSDIVNNTFTIDGLSNLYVNDTIEDSSDEFRYIMVEFDVVAEDTNVVETHKLQLTRRHIDAELGDLSYTYVENDTITETVTFEEVDDNTSKATVAVNSAVESVDFAKAIAKCSKAQGVVVKIDGVDVVQTDSGFNVDLTEAVDGDGCIRKVTIIVTAESGKTKTYEIEVIRKAKNASLNTVIVNAVDITSTREVSSDATIEAVFKANIKDSDISSTIEAISANMFATVSITDDKYTTIDNDKTYDELGKYDLNGATDREIELLIVVTPQDDTVPAKTYKLILTRQYDSTELEQIKIKPAVAGITDEPIVLSHNNGFAPKSDYHYSYYSTTNTIYNWYQTEVIELPTTWTQIALGDILPTAPNMETKITRVTMPDMSTTQHTVCSMREIGAYTIDSTFDMPEGEYVYFKVETTAESGSTSNPYIMVLYKKATSTELDSVVVDGNVATKDATTGIYKVNVSADKNTLPIVINGENKLSKPNTTIKVTVNGEDVTTLLGTSRSGDDKKQVVFTLNEILDKLDYITDRQITAVISVVPEDTSITAKEYTVEITRQHTNTDITNIVLNKDKEVTIAGEQVSVEQTVDAKFVNNAGTLEQHIDVTSKLDTVTINEINTVCPDATVTVEVNGQPKTLPFDISLPNENDSVTLKVTVTPEYDGAEPVERYITIRRMYSDATIGIPVVKAQYSEEKVDSNGNKHQEEKENNVAISLDINDNHNYVGNIQMKHNTSTIEITANNVTAITDISLVDILDRDGNSIANKDSNGNVIGNELYGKTKVYSNTIGLLQYTSIATLNTQNGRTFIVKVTVQPEDKQLPAEEYTITLTKQDDSSLISQVIGNGEEVPVDTQKTHYEYLGRDIKDKAIYVKYLDASTTDVLTEVIAESKFATVTLSRVETQGNITQLATGIGSAIATVPVSDLLERVQVTIQSEDGMSTNKYEILFIRKDDDATIKELYVDDVEIPRADDGNYYIEIPDTVKEIEVRMIPTYKLANASINGQPYKWQETTETITNLDNAKLVDGKVRIELRVQIPAEQSSTGENIVETRYLYIDRVSTDNGIEEITTDNANDGITPGNAPQDSKWGTKNTYEILLEGTANSRDEIDLRIVPVSPKAKVELFDIDGNLLNKEDEGTLITYSLPVETEEITTYKVKVTPQRGEAKEYYIDITPKASQAALKELTIAGVDISLEPGKYEYSVSNLGLSGISSVYALATANSIYPEDNLYGSATVKIYTKENPEGSGEQTTGAATLNNVDLDKTNYITITVTSPNKEKTSTYVIWLKDVSDDRTLEEVSYIDLNGDKQVVEQTPSTDTAYEGEYVITLDSEQATVDISMIATDILSKVSADGQEAEHALNITKDVKSMTDDIVLDIIVKAESENTSKYKLIIRKDTTITGKIITENHNKNYENTKVQIINSNTQEVVEVLTEQDGTFNVKVPAGATYKMVVTKEGYLTYTMVNIPSTYGVRTFTRNIYLVAGEVAGDDEYIELKDFVELNKKAREVIAPVPEEDKKYDFNEDNAIDSEDLKILVKNYDKKSVEVEYSRVVGVIGEVLDATNGDAPIADAKIKLTKVAKTNANGEFEFENVPMNTYTVTVTDKNGVVLGAEDIAIEEGVDYTVGNSKITINPNTSLVDLTVRVNGSRVIISKRGEESTEDITSPKNVKLEAEVKENNIVLKASAEDKNLSSFEFYTEDGTKIAEQTVSGKTKADVEQTYTTTLQFNKEFKFYVEVKDAFGNTTKQEVEVTDNVIRTEADLLTFSSIVNNGTKTYEDETVTLSKDLDLTGTAFTPIGKSTSTKQFKGTFDGKGHTIYNMSINTTSNYAGLFGYTNNATIKNVGVEGNIVSTANYVAGIIGYADNTTVENCYSAVEITANNNIAGIIGQARGNTVIRNCYNSGNITGDATVAGIVGRLNTTEATIENCYNIGTIKGNSIVGEIVGFRVAQVDSNTQIISTGAVNNCYYLSSAQNSGIAQNQSNVTSNISAEMDKLTDKTSTIADITTLSGILGEAFKADTDNLNNGYPVLKWKQAPVTYSLRKMSTPNIVLPVNVEYEVTSEFGVRIDPITKEAGDKHYGIDIAADWKSEILAIADGTVTYAGENGGYGYCIEIKHEINGETIYSFYAHLNRIDVKVGDTVTKGQVIALEGGKVGDIGSGTSTGPHLHFEIRKVSESYSSAVDPRNYLEF